MSSNFSDANYNKIKFVETNSGGSLDDTPTTFLNQQKIVSDTTSEYLELLDYNNKLERDKGTNKDKYYEKIDENQHNVNYRINTTPTIVDSLNRSNPVVYPEEYDPYFEYLSKKKINSINTQVVQTKTVINIDSNNRLKSDKMVVDKFIKLANNSLVFQNNSNYFKILCNNADNYFNVGDKITLRGMPFYTLNFQSLNFFFQNKSNILVLDINPNFLVEIPYYDVIISISGVTNGGLDYFKNIPLQLINQETKVTIFNNNNDYKLQISLPIVLYSENDSDVVLTSDCTIIFYNIGNYPISLINASVPVDIYNLSKYQIISSIASDSITIKINTSISITDTIKLSGYWESDFFYTGSSNMEIGKILNIDYGYVSPSNYTILLDETISNIVNIKMISSEIPNTNKYIITPELNILKSNNLFYWQNLFDNGTYSISIPLGNYSYADLAIVMEQLISKVARSISSIYVNNVYIYNEMSINLDINSNISTFISFNTFILPLSLYSLILIDSTINTCTLRINHPNHNLEVGDRIFITGSIDYYFLSATYINSTDGYIITNVVNDSYYEITISYINLLVPEAGNTSGGYGIKIKARGSFRLLFDKPNTIGSVLGFSNVGGVASITAYSTHVNNYVIQNTTLYIFDINKLLVINNTKTIAETTQQLNNNNINYILLLCNDFDVNININGPYYFYKILLNGPPDTVLYNTFVDASINFDPPIKNLSKLSFKFIGPSGDEFNFFNLNHSFTLEIKSINNCPENTYISTYIGKI